MANNSGMTQQLAVNTIKVGWYLAINSLAERRASRAGAVANAEVKGPVPTRDELLAELRQLLVDDARAVREHVWQGDDASILRLADHLARLRQMFQDLPDLVERRNTRTHDTVRDASSRLDGLPDYYVQDFHFQNGGHLSDQSARLYDVQVETLFYGSADAMRRAALRPIKQYTSGRDQRGVQLLDVACGTGRFLADVRRTYPAMPLSGLDLSPAYLDEARRNLSGLRHVDLLEGAAEAMPLADDSQDIVTCIYLFHELPPEVRKSVAAEIARVLRPGGLFIMIDSLQTGDRPDWDGLLELFPVRFHEPYYRHYLKDDLAALFGERGLQLTKTELAFLSKMVVCRFEG